MNSINWPASSVWVFIAQLGEHCSANAEATGSSPVEAPKIFFSGYFRYCLNCDSLRWSHTHFICIPAVHIITFSKENSGNCVEEVGQIEENRFRIVRITYCETDFLLYNNLLYEFRSIFVLISRVIRSIFRTKVMENIALYISYML